MGGNLRMVSERQRSIPGRPDWPTMCSEPAPDVVIAFNRDIDPKVSFETGQGPKGDANLGFKTDEKADILDGRTAGVLALRDGLYAACQSYANGVLGHDAYALILSQYGNLIVAVTSTGTGVKGAAANAVASPPTVSPHDAAIAALMVACVSEHDPTRLQAIKPDGYPATNHVLSEPFCKSLIDNIATGRLLARKT